MSVVSQESAAWRFVGSVMAAMHDEHLDDGVRMEAIWQAAERLAADVPWLRGEEQ